MQRVPMPLPNFLIIGAMKAGTTTLYRDLARHPDVFLPAEKEPETLVRCSTVEEMRNDYASLFRKANPGQIRGEASTAYTKMPTFKGVPEKARALCGRDLKLVYITREPIRRMVSQYLHEREHRLISEPFEEAIARHGHLIDYSRYDWQIAPWIDAFGERQLLRLSLEEYSASRSQSIGRVLDFLGLDPARLPELDDRKIANSAGEAKTFPEGSLMGKIAGTRLYQRSIKPLMSDELRRRIRTAILSPPKVEKVEVTEAMRQRILQTIADRDREWLAAASEMAGVAAKEND